MSPKEALKFLMVEFVGRFSCDAESCTEQAKTHAAFLALTDALDLPPMKCESGWCELRKEGHNSSERSKE